jgi:hypothetical protein
MVNPLPHKALDPSIVKAFNDKPCQLNAIFTNDDPFAEYASYTKGAFDQGMPMVTKSNTTTDLDLDNVVRECSPEFQARVAQLLKNANVKNVINLPLETYKNVKAQAFADRDKYADAMRNKAPEPELPF